MKDTANNWKKITARMGSLAIALLLALSLASPAFASAEKAPDFTLTDIKGNKFRLKDNLGKPVLLIFSATW